MRLSRRCVSSGRTSFAACRCRSVAAAGDLLFFASPKKPKEKKGDPTVCVPPLRYGQPAVPGPAGVSCKLGYRLKQARALVRLALRSSAQTEGFCGTGSDSGSDGSEVGTAVFIAGVMREGYLGGLMFALSGMP